MHKIFFKTAFLLGALAVLLGAFAAHSLKGSISDYAVAIFETAVRYQFYHVFALLITSFLYRDFPIKFTRWAGILFVTGIILFSGSLYILTYIKGAVIPGYDWVGAVTPIGGAAFILGWIFLFVAVSSKKNKLN